MKTINKSIKDLRAYREKMNELILKTENKNNKRFFALDNTVYQESA